MKFVLSLVMFGTLAAAVPEKPVCNSRTRGHFWPEEANNNKVAARKYLQSGELEMCTMGSWKYRWQFLSIKVHPEKPKPTQSARRMD